MHLCNNLITDRWWSIPLTKKAFYRMPFQFILHAGCSKNCLHHQGYLKILNCVFK